MGPDTRSIRVIVSSTFRDMHAERDRLVTVVFPELRERIEMLGFEFFDVDLRWDVPEKNANGETTNSWEYCRQRVGCQGTPRFPHGVPQWCPLTLGWERGR
jgi:hypothetical protein